VATYYEFEINNGQALMNAGPGSTVPLPNGSTKSPSAVQIGDVVAHFVGEQGTVTDITTQEA
jgi:hypothetical protein